MRRVFAGGGEETETAAGQDLYHRLRQRRHIRRPGQRRQLLVVQLVRGELQRAQARPPALAERVAEATDDFARRAQSQTIRHGSHRGVGEAGQSPSGQEGQTGHARAGGCVVSETDFTAVSSCVSICGLRL